MHASTTENTEAPKRLSASAFHSRKTANDGRKMFLSLPDGTKTEEFFIVAGVDSDIVSKALADYRKLAVKSKAAGKDSVEFSEKHKYATASKAVLGWSFEEPCTPAAVEAFLVEAPHVAVDLDTFIFDRETFFGGAG